MPVGWKLGNSGRDEETAIGRETSKDGLLECETLAASSCAEILHIDVGVGDEQEEVSEVRATSMKACCLIRVRVTETLSSCSFARPFSGPSRHVTLAGQILSQNGRAYFLAPDDIVGQAFLPALPAPQNFPKAHTHQKMNDTLHTVKVDGRSPANDPAAQIGRQTRPHVKSGASDIVQGGSHSEYSEVRFVRSGFGRNKIHGDGDLGDFLDQRTEGAGPTHHSRSHGHAAVGV